MLRNLYEMEGANRRNKHQGLIDTIGNLRASVEAVNTVLDQMGKDYIILSNEYDRISTLNENWAKATKVDLVKRLDN